MENRRSFLKKSSLSLLAVALPVGPSFAVEAKGLLDPVNPESVAVIWYSQTGNTERAGRVIARSLEKSVSRVDAFEYRQADKSPRETMT